MFEPARLQPGTTYAFTLKPGRAGSAAAPTVQPRRFLGHRLQGSIPCIEVERASGATHLIADAAIAAAVPVQFPD
jgi:hypothetical protein